MTTNLSRTNQDTIDTSTMIKKKAIDLSRKSTDLLKTNQDKTIDTSTMIKKYDVIFLVIASCNYHYNLMKYVMKQYMNRYDNIRTFFIYGKHSNYNGNIKDDNDLYFENVEESLRPGILDKTVEAMKHVNQHYEYKYLMRTNLSSFFVLDRFLKYTKTLPQEKCFVGINGQYYGQTFISGAGYLMSRDVVNYFIENRHLMNDKLPDDVASGIIVSRKFKVMKPEIKWRYDIDHNNNILLENVDQLPTDEEYFHFRLKNNTERRNRQKDVKNMKYLYERFYLI